MPVAGDWHGNTGWATHLVSVAARVGCGAVLHVGDFGIWPEDGPFLGAVSRVASASGVHGHWHLRHTTVVDRSWGQVTVEGFASDAEGDGSAWGVLELGDLSVTGGEDVSW